MKKLTLSLLLFFCIKSSIAQYYNKPFNDIVDTLNLKLKNKDQVNNTINGIIINSELYNTLWKNFITQAISDNNNVWKPLKDFNIQFKTFETRDNPTASLGFTYDFNYDFAKYTEQNKNRISNSFGLTAKGNVAFNKIINPVDFLETRAHYNYSHFIGGVVLQKDSAIFTELNNIRFKLANEINMNSKDAIRLWEELGNKIVMSNQYYYSISPKFAFESNQDFSKTQLTPGLSIDLGTKAWNKKNILTYFNVFDYPFALLRYITGTDATFNVYGSTIPTAQFTFDYVIPSKDSTREKLVGNINPFPRIKFETGFRTFITRVKNENLFFNANYRFYKEVYATDAIKKANLNINSYLVMALQTTSGFYVSYAKGKLPFDAKSDQVYSIGFNYKFN